MADTVQTSQSLEPWGPQQPHLQNIFGQAQAQNQAIGPFPFPGHMTVGYSPQEQAGQRMTEQYAFTGAMDQAQDMQRAQKFALGDVLYPQSNPALRSHAAGAIQPVAEMLHEQTLPQMGSGAVRAGAYGGSRQGIAQALAADKAYEDMLNTTQQIYSNAYNTGLQTFDRALQQAPTTLMAGTLPAQLVSASGEMDRSLAQQLLNEDIYRWNFGQNLPGTKTADYQNLIQGGYGGSSTGTVPSLYQEPSGVEKAIGGATTVLGFVDSLNKISGGGVTSAIESLFSGSWFD